MSSHLKIAIIGGGAAGFFSAINTKIHFPKSEVVLFEKTDKVLSKVKISGGGRCNVTNNCLDTDLLASNYPRGERFLKKAFKQFAVEDTIQWFTKRKVKLKAEADGRMFPETDNSQTIIHCFLDEAQKQGVKIQLKTTILRIRQEETGFKLSTKEADYFFDRVIITVGGAPKSANLNWLENIGCKVVEPVPSLFTFNMPKNPILQLMGSTNSPTTAKIEGEKLQSEGALLVTHWGMSGPAILKLSAWGARTLAEKEYTFNLLVNWSNVANEEKLRQALMKFSTSEHQAKKINTINPFGISKRLWEFLCQKTDFHPDMRWGDLGKKTLNKLTNTLFNDNYPVSGKTTFKEEFVTAGGVSLSQINAQTMEHKTIKGLFFAGEILDIDGITGGFNFQAAWTTGFIASKNVGL